MSDIIEKTKLPFSELGVSTDIQVEELFVELRQAATTESLALANEEELEQFRIRWTGKKNGIRLRVNGNWLKKAAPELRKSTGQAFNVFFNQIIQSLQDDATNRVRSGNASVPGASSFDLTLPGFEYPAGTRHILTQTIEEITGIFERIGFSIVEGPEVEPSYYNFTALNIPPDHPAVDDMDSLYIGMGMGDGADLVLRTHTSPMQIRTMENQKPPVRIVVPGKVYRRDNPDATHSFMFHQVEGLAVDRDITFADLKGSLEYFLREFFGPDLKTRFCATYFPFTEPSADVYGSCIFCAGSGCRVCKQSGWIELLGCGMVDPAVFGFVNYDPEEVSGFAFGMGVERLAMLKYGVDDLQHFFRSDVRFLHQFR